MKKEYICQKCCKKFKSKYNLERHLNRKKPCDILFHCKFCSSKASSRKLLDKHIRDCHKNKEDKLKSKCQNCHKLVYLYNHCKSAEVLIKEQRNIYIFNNVRITYNQNPIVEPIIFNKYLPKLLHFSEPVKIIKDILIDNYKKEELEEYSFFCIDPEEADYLINTKYGWLFDTKGHYLKKIILENIKECLGEIIDYQKDIFDKEKIEKLKRVRKVLNEFLNIDFLNLINEEFYVLSLWNKPKLSIVI